MMYPMYPCDLLSERRFDCCECPFRDSSSCTVFDAQEIIDTLADIVYNGKLLIEAAQKKLKEDVTNG